MRRNDTFMIPSYWILPVLALALVKCFTAQSPPPPRVAVGSSIEILLHDEDTDGDQRITVNDTLVAGTERGDKRFTFGRGGIPGLEVTGTYPLANLLEELTL